MPGTLASRSSTKQFRFCRTCYWLFLFSLRFCYLGQPASLSRGVAYNDGAKIRESLCRWLDWFRPASLILGFLIALSVLAPSFEAGDLIKSLGVGTVAIGFAFQNILQNFLAGILLLLQEPFHLGDFIRVRGIEGTVYDIQSRATIVSTKDGRRVVIPNAVLFTSPVVRRKSSVSGSLNSPQLNCRYMSRNALQLANAIQESDGVQGGIEAAEFAVAFLQESGRCGIGRDAGGDFDDRVAGLVDGGEVASAHGSQDGGTEGCAFFAGNEFDFTGVNVGLNLTPEA